MLVGYCAYEYFAYFVYSYLKSTLERTCDEYTSCAGKIVTVLNPGH
jgi:hypothetical protein